MKQMNSLNLSPSTTNATCRIHLPSLKVQIKNQLSLPLQVFSETPATISYSTTMNAKKVIYAECTSHIKCEMKPRGDKTAGCW